MSARHGHSRRDFLQHSLAGAAALSWLQPTYCLAQPSETVRHASFGANGMAGADLNAIASHPNVKLVCVAEVDEARAIDLRKKFPDTRVYQDWRVMLDKEAKNLDCVNVSTPDHMHAPMAMSAMNHGLHVYCQKPLTHDIYESRRLTDVANEKKLITQMGIQIHSSIEYRAAVHWIQAGVIGPVKEVHSWSSKKWGDPSPLPTKTDPVPASLDWNLWLGVTAERPYIGGGYYHPGNWRKRRDFGTGTFGDMGCHILDPACKALELKIARSVKSVGNGPNATNWGNDVVVEYDYTPTKFTAEEGLKLTWYDGDKRPSKEAVAILGDAALPDQGSVFIGSKGALLLPHIAYPTLYPGDKFADTKRPELEGINHWHSFVNAVRGMGTTSANFDYAGPLTEMVLLGGVATFSPQESLTWDAAKLEFTNSKAATEKVRRPYRKGWEVEGLS